MEPMNKIEYIELEKKVNQIEELANSVEETFKKIDDLINDNVNSGKGIWDGIDAESFKNEWFNLKENDPAITNIFRIQANNINEVLKITTDK